MAMAYTEHSIARVVKIESKIDRSLKTQNRHSTANQICDHLWKTFNIRRTKSYKRKQHHTTNTVYYYYYYYCNHFTTLRPGLPGWIGTRRINHSGFCWNRDGGVAVESASHMQAICTSLQKITMPAPHHSDFYGPDALPDTQPKASKPWRQQHTQKQINSEAKHRTNITTSRSKSVVFRKSVIGVSTGFQLAK